MYFIAMYILNLFIYLMMGIDLRLTVHQAGVYTTRLALSPNGNEYCDYIYFYL